MWPKEKIKKDFGFSPDYGDAAALTFCEPVAIKKISRPPPRRVLAR
jgi:hypothetical protein